MISLESVVAAAAAMYLAALLPAAAVTALKGRYLIFAVGFLTFGLVWFLGAIGLAPPESWWARTIYDGRQRDRAEDPERHPRSWWPIRGYMAAGLVCFAVLGLFAAMAAPILGVHGKALEYSINGGPSYFGETCRHLSDDSWRCLVTDAGASGGAPYRVNARGSGCWTATRLGGPSGEGGTPKRLSGCITIFDYLRLFDRVLD